MSMIVAVRENAHVEPREHSVLSRCVLVREFMTTNDRITAPNARAEIQLKLGTVYQGFTGISIEGYASPHQLAVRSSADAWASYGIQILRHDISDDNELVVYFVAHKAAPFDRTIPVVEIFQGPEAAAPVAKDVQVTRSETPAKVPGVVEVTETKHYRAPSERPAEPAGNQVSDAQRVADWLNEPDGGRVVEMGTDSAVARQLPTGKAAGVSVPDAGDDQRVDDSDMASVDAATLAPDAAYQARQDHLEGKASDYTPKVLQTDFPDDAPPPPPPMVDEAPPPPPVGEGLQSVNAVDL